MTLYPIINKLVFELMVTVKLQQYIRTKQNLIKIKKSIQICIIPNNFTDNWSSKLVILKVTFKFPIFFAPCSKPYDSASQM